MLFLDEIHRMARPAEEMLYVAMEDFRVDVVVGKGAGRHRDPARPAAVHHRRGDDPGRACCPGRCATGSASPATSTSTRPPSWSRCCAARPGCSASGSTDEGGRRDREPLPGHAADRQPAAAPGARLGPGARGRQRSTPTAARAALTVYAVDERGPRPARPGGARGAVPAVRRRPGRAVDARRRRGRGARDRRDGRRAVPRARGAASAGRRAGGSRRPATWRHLGLAVPRAAPSRTSSTPRTASDGPAAPMIDSTARPASLCCVTRLA